MTGIYKHKTGEQASHWKGGRPRCPVCYKVLSNYDAKFCKKHLPRLDKRGSNSNFWKGDEVKYGGLHQWVNKELGKPKICQVCGNKKAKRYEWANLQKNYIRDLSVWTRLCSSCHIKHDRYNYELIIRYSYDRK